MSAKSAPSPRRNCRAAGGGWRGRVRCRDGVIRHIQADGPSKTAASDAARTRAADTADSARRPTTGSGAANLTPTSTLADLADAWITQTERAGDVATQSLAEYRRHARTISTGIGQLQIREATAGTCQWFVDTAAAEQPAKAKMLRMVLRAMFTLAIRVDAYDGPNPAREVSIPEAQRGAVRAMTVDELIAYREHMRRWEATPARSDGTRGGRPRVKGLRDLVDVQLGTGTRIGELLALRWSDIDLEADNPTATISGTLARLPGTRAAGGGLTRQNHPKTDAGWRVVKLPKFAVDTLLRLQVTSPGNEFDAVFPSSTGTWRDPHNVRRQLRDAHGERWAWVTPHTFRKTVATVVERESSLADAAAQLGHSGTAVTREHYVQRAHEAPDLTAALAALAPVRDDSGSQNV